MSYSMYLLTALATLPQAGDGPAGDATGANQADWREVIEPALQRMQHVVEQFQQNRLTPTALMDFEEHLQNELRELGRATLQWTNNRREAAAADLPKHVWFEASQYTRLNAKTPQNVWTRFGQIRLWRVG